MPEEKPADNVIERLMDRIKKLEDENRKWMRLAGTNRLTGLPNSLMLYQIVLPKELRKGDEEPVSLACILICPDGLGEINQKHGRIVGDQLIKQIGAFLKQQIEPGEQLFHPDGANFAILIAEGSEGRARRKATMIKNQFRETTFTVEKQDFKNLTCSAGVADIEGEISAGDIPKHIEELYRELSNRLYRAKERGGNLVVGSPRVKT